MKDGTYNRNWINIVSPHFFTYEILVILYAFNTMIFLINCMSNKVFKSQSLFLLFAKPLDYMLFKKISCLCYLIFIQIIPINFPIVHYNVFLLATKNLRKDICLNPIFSRVYIIWHVIFMRLYFSFKVILFLYLYYHPNTPSNRFSLLLFYRCPTLSLLHS